MSISDSPRSVSRTPVAGAVARGLDRQPAVGLTGLSVAVAVFAILGVVIAPLRSLEILGALTTFSLPALIASALWWHGWPARGLSRPVAGIVNTALIVSLALALTALAQIIVGRGDLGHLLDTTAAAPSHAPGRPAFPSYPWTLPLAGLIFLTMILLTFVCDRWPLRKLGDVASGFVAIAVSWAVGLLAYFTLANWNPIVPAPVQKVLGLSNPGGPVSAFDLLAWALCVAVWAVVVFIRGKPLAPIRSTPVRVLAGNVAVIALGWVTFRLLLNTAGLDVPEIAAICGSTIAASIIVALVFEAWPARLARSDGGIVAGILASIAALAIVMYVVLRAIGNARATWTPANPVDLWVTVCTLNFLAAGSILWYGVWRRWPASPVTEPPASGE